jgi:F0F1-type ATP synthase membrane subunit b/b'
MFKSDWSYELGQVRQTVEEVVDEKLSPMVHGAIVTAGEQLSAVVAEAGEQLQENIKTLSAEIHNQRRMTKEDVVELIDYASCKIGSTIDARLNQAKSEI